MKRNKGAFHLIIGTIGYSDDLGVLLFALSHISENITPEIKAKARLKLQNWFGKIDEEGLRDIDNNSI